MKQNKKNIYIALTLLWTVIIFSFSLQPGEVSSDMSQGFGRWLLQTFAPWLLDYMESLSPEQLEYLHFLLRKCAHFTEYFILGVLAISAVYQTKFSNKWRYALLYGVLVAAIDETIQRFVPERAGRLADVFLDSSGVFFGIICYLLFKKFSCSRSSIC